jgi:Uma2 family endonuclease
MTQLACKTMTVAEYLAFEQATELRHEYVNGELIEMPGASRQHSTIVKNIVKALDDIAIAKGCELRPVDIKTHTTPSRYRYPDIVISCSGGDNPCIIENSCFIVEIVSNSSTDADPSIKLIKYTKLPSLQAYVIVSDTVRRVFLYQRQDAAWTFTVISGSGQLAIPMLETTLSLDQIYASLAIAPANASIDANPTIKT